jgi:CubicO group peptidase (beta-lactamase class C family)
VDRFADKPARRLRSARARRGAGDDAWRIDELFQRRLRGRRRLAERITGQAWEALVRERVLAPLGLSSAGYDWPASADPASPRGHWEDAGGFRADVPESFTLGPILRVAGDLHMNAADLCAFARSHLRRLAGTFTVVVALQPPRGRAIVLMTNAGDESVALATGVLDDFATAFDAE